MAESVDREVFASDSGVASDAAMSIDEVNLSVLVLSWTLALEPHLSALSNLTRAADPDTHEVSPRENAHAVAAAAMAIFLFESKAARLQAIGRPVSLSPELKERVTEVSVLRHTLVHNHVWEVMLRRSNEDWERPAELGRAAALHGYMDTPAYLNVSVDRGTKRTRILGLHLVPTEVGRWDVVCLLPVIVEALDELNTHDVPNMQSPADIIIKIAGKATPLRRATELLA